MLSAGNLIPADGVVLEAKDFFVNQAVLTGETFPVKKEAGVVPEAASLTERTNTVFMGTSVRSGTAKVLIAQTGAGTNYGQIADQLNLRPPETEFERGIRHFGLMLSQIMIVLILIVFAMNVIFQKPPIDSLLAHCLPPCTAHPANRIFSIESGAWHRQGQTADDALTFPQQSRRGFAASRPTARTCAVL